MHVISAALLALSACTQGPPSRVAGSDQEILNGIAARCSLPPSVFDLRSKRELHFKPPFDAKYESVDCALQEIKKSGIPFKMGFVGNEAYIGNEQ